MHPTDPAAPDPHARSAFRPTRLTSAVVAGGAAFAMVLAGLGIASAQTTDSTATPPPATSAEGDEGAAGEPERRRRHHRHPVAAPARIAAILGITVDELEARLAEGETISAIAGDRTDEVVAALVAEATERLDAAVAAGRLSAEEAAKKKARAEERFTALVDRTPPAGGGRGPKHARR